MTDAASTSRAAPVAEQERLLAIDATRGLALLGILLVNIQSFAAPFGQFITPHPESPDTLTRACFYIVKVFCEGKFYPLFSLLFGMGLVLQMRSVSARSGERTFRWLYVRRLLILMAIGLAHALLIWYGDILFVYAFAGFILLLASRLSARAMFITGIVLMVVATVLGAPLTAILAPKPPAAASSSATTPPPAPPTTDSSTSHPSAPPAKIPDGLDRAAESSPFFRLMQAYRDGELQGGPEEKLYQDLEQQAFHDGPWLAAFLFRAWTWGMYIVFSLAGFGWHVVGMFFVGAALLKHGFFDPARRPLRRRLLLVGLCLALPALAASTFSMSVTPYPGFLRVMLASIVLLLCGPLLSLAYLSAVSLAVDAGRGRAITRTLAAVGRMALSNYLTQSLVCTFIFYHWGLAQFGHWTRPERIALVLALFAAQCVISRLWLNRFRFGPMEWLWRSLTYLHPQPMRAPRA